MRSIRYLQLSLIMLAATVQAETNPAAPPIIRLDNNLDLVKIPAGRFQMGQKGDSPYMQPVHQRHIDYPFWIGKTEVTFTQYDAYIDATDKIRPDARGWGRGERPVINITWQQAQDFTQWLSKTNVRDMRCRLPSEAEWEYAARGGTSSRYHWGDAIGKNQANCKSCGSRWDYRQTAPVASFPANPFGLHDMHGNVAEWVQDHWHDTYKSAPDDGSAREDSDTPNARVTRSGSWISPPEGVSSAMRSITLAEFANMATGFRVVCLPPESSNL